MQNYRFKNKPRHNFQFLKNKHEKFINFKFQQYFEQFQKFKAYQSTNPSTHPANHPPSPKKRSSKMS